MENYSNLFLSLKKLQSKIRNIKVIQIARSKLYLDSMYPLIDDVNKFLQNKDDIFLELNITFLTDHNKYEKLYNFYLESIDQSFDFVCSDFSYLTLAPEIVSNDNLFSSLYKQVSEKIDKQLKLPKEEIDVKSIDCIQPEEIGLIYAYKLHLFKCLLEERNIMINNPVNYYYYYEDLLSYIFKNNLRGNQELRNVYSKANEATFLQKMKVIGLDDVEEFLDYHFQFFQRHKGDKLDWLQHTEVLLQSSLSKERQEIVSEWFKSRNRSGSTKSKVKLNIDSWEQLIKPELYKRLDEIEAKIPLRVENWKSGIDKIGCAAFCELLKEKGYFNKTKFPKKTLRLYALHKYQNIIEVQLNTSNNEARDTHKKQLNQYFIK